MPAYKINPFLISLKPIYLTYEDAKKAPRSRGRRRAQREHISYTLINTNSKAHCFLLYRDSPTNFTKKRFNLERRAFLLQRTKRREHNSAFSFKQKGALNRFYRKARPPWQTKRAKNNFIFLIKM